MRTCFLAGLLVALPGCGLLGDPMSDPDFRAYLDAKIDAVAGVAASKAAERWSVNEPSVVDEIKRSVATGLHAAAEAAHVAISEHGKEQEDRLLAAGEKFLGSVSSATSLSSDPVSIGIGSIAALGAAMLGAKRLKRKRDSERGAA